jgi:hypothetical protein
MQNEIMSGVSGRMTSLRKMAGFLHFHATACHGALGLVEDEAGEEINTHFLPLTVTSKTTIAATPVSERLGTGHALSSRRSHPDTTADGKPNGNDHRALKE